MTDRMSGRARLARNNINILGVAPVPQGDKWDVPVYVTYEFQYRLPNGSTVWRKTCGVYPGCLKGLCDKILDDVRSLRRELEHDD